MEQCEKLLVAGKGSTEEGGEVCGLEQGVPFVGGHVPAYVAPFCGPLDWEEAGVWVLFLVEDGGLLDHCAFCGRFLSLQFPSSFVN